MALGGTQSLPGQRAQRRSYACCCEPPSLCPASPASPVLHQQPSWREPAPQAPPTVCLANTGTAPVSLCPLAAV